jgi:hypothetical protein
MFFDRTLSRAAALVSIAAFFSVAGCQSARHHYQPPATRPSAHVVFYDWPSVHARVDPPAGWVAQPLKIDARHTHQVWVSPTGDTAYGVIYFSLPIPVSADFVLPFFLRAMRAKEGDATLVSKVDDPQLPGVRFEAEGGIYHIQANLITAGFEGWSVYAGRLRQRATNETELAQARAARQETILEVK